ncbi:MAG: hypothetical protein IK955_06075 [Clostridia bacterium]|nr:hypothetical protein [Clostridia bacterium]MBP3938957.1 hypothetical protein [Clostridia bacterium]
MFTINDLSFDMFSIVTILLIPGCLIACFKAKKKQPGNPMNKIIGFGAVLYAALFFKRYSETHIVSVSFSKSTNVIFWILASAYAVAVVIGLVLAHKRGYGDRELLKRLKPLFTMIPILVIVLLILIVFMKLEENNMLP